MVRDGGLIETEKLFRGRIVGEIYAEYDQAMREVEEKLDDYLRRFRIKDETWRRWVDQGVKTKAEYDKWKTGQIAVGKRWEKMKDTLARDLHSTNEIARNIIEGYKPDIYAFNFNFGTFEVERGSGVDTGFVLYDHESVERLLKKHPDILPTPSTKDLTAAAAKDILWQKKRIQSAMVQGILQGDGMLDLATRLAEKMGETNRKAAIRNARTAYTGVMNAGRMDSFYRAEQLGVEMQQMWTATLDMRTRPGHRELDGVTKGLDEIFENEIGPIRYPGDPTADPENLWNCRCCLRAVVKGLTSRSRLTRSTEALEGMTYEQWKESKVVKTNPILLPELKAKQEKEFYLNEYRLLGTVGNRRR